MELATQTENFLIFSWFINYEIKPTTLTFLVLAARVTSPRKNWKSRSTSRSKSARKSCVYASQSFLKIKYVVRSDRDDARFVKVWRGKLRDRQKKNLT